MKPLLSPKQMFTGQRDDTTMKMRRMQSMLDQQDKRIAELERILAQLVDTPAKRGRGRPRNDEASSRPAA